MLMSFLSHILCAWFAFLLPSYETFKALSHRPLSEPQLQRWSMYWSVVGAFVAFEYAAEWLISWLPFYWEIKTIFLLYLAFPSTQGSTYIYTSYLQPFFARNEADLDEGIAQIQTNVLTFIRTRLAALWETIFNMLTKQQSATSSGSPGTPPPNGTASAPAGLQTVFSLWNTYGPSVLNTFGSKGSSAVASASSSSVNTSGLGAQQRSPVHTPSASPSFPEPQHFS